MEVIVTFLKHNYNILIISKLNQNSIKIDIGI